MNEKELKTISKKYPLNEKLKFNLAFMEQDQGNIQEAKKSYLFLIKQAKLNFGFDKVIHFIEFICNINSILNNRGIHMKKLFILFSVIASFSLIGFSSAKACENKNDVPLTSLTLSSALSANNHTKGFMNAASPGVINVFLPNKFYKNDDEYLSKLSV